MNRLLLASAIGALAACAPASASVIHTVQPGETLWSIAAANGFSTHALAAANGLSDNSNVILGSQIKIPSESEAATALETGQPLSSSSSSSGAPPLGAYTVRSGDTLSSIAARSAPPGPRGPDRAPLPAARAGEPPPVPGARARAGCPRLSGRGDRLAGE